MSHLDAIVTQEILRDCESNDLSLDTLLAQNVINQKEFYNLLASLIYSSDRVANTVGHYDAYRKM